MAFLRQCLFELRRRHEPHGEHNSLADVASCVSETFNDPATGARLEARAARVATGERYWPGNATARQPRLNPFVTGAVKK
jgi:hypothetical protein